MHMDILLKKHVDSIATSLSFQIVASAFQNYI